MFKVAVKTPERRHWRRYGVFFVNFEYILHFVLVFLLLTLNKDLPAGKSRLIPSWPVFMKLLNSEVHSKLCKNI